MAVRSMAFCDTFSDIRAAGSPDTSGATPTVLILGKTTINDGIGGHFYWNSASTAAEDDNTIQATSVTTGRWIRLTLI